MNKHKNITLDAPAPILIIDAMGIYWLTITYICCILSLQSIATMPQIV